MAPADALSRRDHVDTSLDNNNSSIVPSPAIINALDLSLVRHITSSSASDPLVLRAIQNLSNETPLFPCSARWIGHSTMAIYTINIASMSHPRLDRLFFIQYIPRIPQDILDAFVLRQSSNVTFGGQAFPPLSIVLLPDVQSASKTRFALTQSAPRLVPLNPPPSFCSNNSPSILSPISSCLTDMIL
jgi:hypothetical protein